MRTVVLSDRSPPQFPEALPPLRRPRHSPTSRTRSKQHRLRHLCSIHTTCQVPKGVAPNPAWNTTSALPAGCHKETIVCTVLSHRLRRLRSVPRRFHTPICSLRHSRESPSIESSLTFEGHISQSCGAHINLVHPFLAGTRRFIHTLYVSSVACDKEFNF